MSPRFFPEVLTEVLGEELEISLRTYKRWTDGDGVKADGRPDAEGGRSVTSPRESASTEESEQTRGLQGYSPESGMELGHHVLGDDHHWNIPPTVLGDGHL
ncbi:MAG: hypothetical protein KZQ81_16220 [Candidatus Thiodiazotropha sp. (ex Rostrolucina anterorostrata)]|nr:hypothetical protein [Candidatus Thiodiazotropha sp. (ex Rostrolucina anterorostrata)]